MHPKSIPDQFGVFTWIKDVDRLKLVALNVRLTSRRKSMGTWQGAHSISLCTARGGIYSFHVALKLLHAKQDWKVYHVSITS